MSPQIDIDDEVLEVLKRHAEPFTDTPNSVLRHLLGLGDGQPTPATAASGAARSSLSPHSHKASKRAATSAPTRTRAARGTLLPEERYVLPLLTVLIDLGGSAPFRDIVKAVGKQLEAELTPADKDNLASGSVRWQNRLQFVRLRLVERGLLDRDMPRGVWGITDEGRKAVENGETR